MEKLKAVKSLTQKKVGDFGATFGVQERVTVKMLNGLNSRIKELRSEKKRNKTGQYANSL